MSDIKDLSKYLYSISKLGESEPEVVAKIESRLLELSNSQIELAIAIVNLHSTEWGTDAARMTKSTCTDIVAKLREHLKK